jgi:hypothetical protein
MRNLVKPKPMTLPFILNDVWSMIKDYGSLSPALFLAAWSHPMVYKDDNL